jgi:hypothetical protein
MFDRALLNVARLKSRRPVMRSAMIIRLPPVPPPESDIEAATLADSYTTAKKHGYSITSSAIARSCGGILRPSALAVLALMTNSTLVDCVTGRSRGVSPSRLRSGIGLTRRDLRAADSVPLWQNLTSILERYVSHRREATQRAAPPKTDEFSSPDAGAVP